jgi:hypothetical protein
VGGRSTLKALYFGTNSAHFGGAMLVRYERMFATEDRTVDELRERRREARRCELRSLSEQEARIKQRVTQIVREADDEEDWRGGLLVECAVAGAGLQQRSPHGCGDHAHE